MYSFFGYSLNIYFSINDVIINNILEKNRVVFNKVFIFRVNLKRSFSFFLDSKSIILEYWVLICPMDLIDKPNGLPEKLTNKDNIIETIPIINSESLIEHLKIIVKNIEHNTNRK